MSEGTLEPTPKRLEKARREGDFGASGAPAAALSLFAAVLVLPSLAAVVTSEARTSMRAAIAQSAMAAPDANVIGPRTLVLSVLATAAPMVALVAVVAGMSTLLETRFGFAPSRLLGAAKGSRPILGPFFRGLLSASLSVAIMLGALRASAVALAHTTTHTLEALIPRLAAIPTIVLRTGVALALAAAILETIFALRAHQAKLRMTPRQVEDERKQGEGDPEVRAARKRVAETLFSDVPLRGLPRETTVCVHAENTAAVVSWAKERDAAPRLIKKLQGKDADRLMREAISEDIPTTYDAQLAASLSATVSIGQELPEALYDPIATLFATNAPR